jgi:hypothetical protein
LNTTDTTDTAYRGTSRARAWGSSASKSSYRSSCAASTARVRTCRRATIEYTASQASGTTQTAYGSSYPTYATYTGNRSG